MWSGTSDQVTVIMINLLYTLPKLSKNLEINILDLLLDVYLLKSTISKELPIIFLMCTINHEQVLELKNILNASERWVNVLEQDLESYIVLDTDLAQCNMIDVPIPHVLCFEKKIVYYVINFWDGWLIWILVIRTIRSHSVKSTASRLITIMGF